MVITAEPGRASRPARGASGATFAAAPGLEEERRIAAVVEAWITGRRHPVHRSIVFAEVLDDRVGQTLVVGDGGDNTCMGR